MLRHFLVALVALCPCLLHAQVTGFSYELDTVFAANEPFGLANHGVHNVYVNFTRTSSEQCIQIQAHRPWASLLPAATTRLQHPSSLTPATTLRSLLHSLTTNTIPFGPSGWKLQMRLDNCQPTLGWVALGFVCWIDHRTGTLYITGTTGDWPVNAVAGEDLRVLIARVTTECGFSLQACTQTYVGGSQDEVLQGCFSIDVPSPTPGECGEPLACNFVS